MLFLQKKNGENFQISFYYVFSKNDQQVDTIPERIKTVSKIASFIMTKQHFRKVFVKSEQKLTAIRASFTPLHVIF